MGAYLHLRGLAELDDSMSDSTSSRETAESLNEPGCAASGAFSAHCPGFLTSSATTSKIDDCANFWAGQLDDVFEDLQVKSRPQNSPTATMGWSGIGEHDAPKIRTERGQDRKEKGECSSGNSGLRTREGSVENRTIDVRLLDLGGPSASFHQSSSRGEWRDGVGKERGVANGPIRGGLEESGATHSSSSSSRGCDEDLEDQSERLPDHLLIELLVRVPTRDWPAAACVKKRWAHLFKGEGLWHSALTKKWPGATFTKRWPGPIARGSSKRRYTALYVSDSLFARDKVEGVNEVAGHVYLFLKEQLESPTPPVSYGLLHGTIIDQFLACCKTGDEAHNLASHIWIAVLDNLDESEDTFRLLMRIAEEWEVFPSYPYARSHAVQWRLFERLFTDFRDCLSQYNYFDVLTRVRNKFEMIPQTWLGY